MPDIAVIGAGLIGRRHADLIHRRGWLSALVDPAPAAQDYAQTLGVECFADLADYLTKNRPDGAVIATPNQLHLTHGTACIAAGVPVLIEKPLADTSEAGKALVQSARAAQVPVLVGHHRRHNPLIHTAKAAIAEGRLGRVVSVHGQFWLYKPDDYFDVGWRKQAGAGPVFINLIHDIDLLRYLCGDVVSVQARQANAVRGHEVEDTAVILLEFASGALGTVNVSDTIAAPWSWEMTAGENPAYPNTAEACYRIGGTEAALSVPDLRLWHHPTARSWWAPIEAETLTYEASDPLERQLDHFGEVITGATAPLVSAEEGLKTLQVTEAIQHAAVTGKIVDL
ncbi:MAG: Gfo/Idh/MocA family oxidoreductase [Pseudomonadota bacterium]